MIIQLDCETLTGRKDVQFIFVSLSFIAIPSVYSDSPPHPQPHPDKRKICWYSYYRHSECGLIWKQYLCRFNQVMRSLRWAESNMSRFISLIKLGCLYTGKQRGKTMWRYTVNIMWKWRGKLEWQICKPRNAKVCWAIIEEARKETLQVSEGAWSSGHFDFRLLASRTVRQQILL